MGDLIDREFALEKINDNHYLLLGDSPECNRFRMTVKIFLNRLPLAKPEPKWILVAEQMPEMRKVVLTTTSWGDIYLMFRTMGCWRSFEEGLSFNDDEVVAWMPLPQPYERGQG